MRPFQNVPWPLARSVLTVLTIAGLALSGCGAPPVASTPTSPPPAPTVAQAVAPTLSIDHATLQEKEKTPEVSTDELRQLLATKRATVFDARPFKEYAISHIPGVLNVAPKPGQPMSQYVSDVAEIERIVKDKATPIVLYCNGPYCGKSKRLAEELLGASFTNVRRYQLGIPTWRALIGLTQIERDGVRYVLENDRTAALFDARDPAEFAAGSLPGARNLVLADVVKAKDDGRLPMEDHNTRIIVIGKDAEQARAVAEAIAKNAFHNVSFYAGTLDSLK
jgi:rhodanese-related sulfurtransferase